MFAGAHYAVLVVLSLMGMGIINCEQPEMMWRICLSGRISYSTDQAFITGKSTESPAIGLQLPVLELLVHIQKSRISPEMCRNHGL
jgi:hypothetical protein